MEQFSTVEDNGMGISVEKLKRINESLAGESGFEAAAGIGIRNVNARIKNYYGSFCGIWLESELGNYTRVHLRIKDISVMGERGESDMRVIVADDEFFARKALVKRIGELSEEIEVLRGGRKRQTSYGAFEESWSRFGRYRYPYAGYGRAGGCKKQVKDRFPETSVIIESGYADFVYYATTAIRYGVKDYLTKPQGDKRKNWKEPYRE